MYALDARVCNNRQATTEAREIEADHFKEWGDHTYWVALEVKCPACKRRYVAPMPQDYSGANTSCPHCLIEIEL